MERNAAYEIERLVQFGLQQGLLEELDCYVARNTLLDLFGLAEPFDGPVEEPLPQLPTEILDSLLDYAAQKELFDGEVRSLRINFEARIMGALMPRESEVARRFAQLYQTKGAKAATDWFYHLCRVSNYIRTADVARNIKWDYHCQYGKLEITINLTKPEKDPKTIALERMQPSSSYPRCMLCPENIGYAGRVNFPARQYHRIVPVTLAGEEWFLQYSPYVYYNEHCIVFGKKHEPMQIEHKTFCRLFDFVEQFPHYTCGSNADLPIVGGSILSHNHFQGGCYRFPMQNAVSLTRYRCEDFPKLTVDRINWPMAAIRVQGHNRDEMIAFADRMLTAWRGYSDESVDILASSTEDGKTVLHNTITPILHYEEKAGFILDLVPRNNRTCAEYPDGIFHPHKEVHHIKKENIGLIEVMGLAILPGRLKAQSETIHKVLTGKLDVGEAAASCPEHTEWIHELTLHYGTALSEEKADEVIKQEIGAKFAACLEHAGVFKLDAAGLAACDRFMATIGCNKL